MSARSEQLHRQLQDLLARIPASGSYESVSLTQQISRLVSEIEREEGRRSSVPEEAATVPASRAGLVPG